MIFPSLISGICLSFGIQLLSLDQPTLPSVTIRQNRRKFMEKYPRRTATQKQQQQEGVGKQPPQADPFVDNMLL